jgi:hypothetical protein
MTDMERRPFEDDFRKAFDGAEATPGENVWTNIELDLERSEGKKMKRRILFYKMLAAASVAFAMAMAGLGFYAINNSTESGFNGIASGDTEKHPPVTPQVTAENDNQQNTTSNFDPYEGIDQVTNNTSVTGTGADHIAGNIHTKNPSANVAESNGRNVTDLRDGQHLAGQKQPGSGADSNGNSMAAGAPSLAGVTAESSTSAPENGTPNKTSTFPVEQAWSPQLAAAEGTSRRTDVTEGGHATDNGTVASRIENDVIFSESEHNSVVVVQEKRSLPALYVYSGLQDLPGRNGVEADPVQLMLQRLKDLEEELSGKKVADAKKRKADKKENLWTSLGFSAGGFNGEANVPSPTQSNALFSNTVNNQAKASGVAYSFGVSMGTRIGERFVIQGGCNYLSNNSTYVSDQVVRSADFQQFKVATFNDLRIAESSLLNNTMVIPTAPYDVQSNLEYITVPVQAGYLIIDRRFGVQMNAGVSTDLFLQNTVEAEGSAVNKTTMERGAESPYRSLNFSGLVSTEFTYRIGGHYRVALNPGLRYPFNSLYKNSTGIESNPLTFDIGLRFRYIFH